ncbi:hypothetical protein ACQKJG_18255 [Priestia megaterium]|uniref:hypothetical protein n=1 Tax=Priestia megaterium TaxID=1404 RepID=UPI003D06178C
MTNRRNRIGEIHFTQTHLKVVNDVLINKKTQAATAEKYDIPLTTVHDILKRWELRIDKSPLMLTIEQVKEKVAKGEDIEIFALPLSHRTQRTLRYGGKCQTYKDLLYLYDHQPLKYKHIDGLGAIAQREIRQFLDSIRDTDTAAAPKEEVYTALTYEQIAEKWAKDLHIPTMSLPLPLGIQNKLCRGRIFSFDDLMTFYMNKKGRLKLINGVGATTEKALLELIDEVNKIRVQKCEEAK